MQAMETVTSAESATSPATSRFLPPAESSRVGLIGNRPVSDQRVLLFVESVYGFGHFNITDLLAKEITNLGLDVAVASSTFDHNGYSFDFGGAKRFYLPPMGVNADNKMCKPNQEAFNYSGDPYSELIYQRTREVLKQYEPSLIVYELYPFMQTWRDATARAVNDHYEAAGKDLPERVVLCRDIIHAKNPTAVLNRLKKYCSRLMVRGDSHFARLEDSQPEWAEIPLPIDYIGNFAAKTQFTGNISPKEEIVIFGGGGYRGKKDTSFLEAVVDVSRYTKAFRDYRFNIIVSEGTPEDVARSMIQSMASNCTLSAPVGTDIFKQMLASATAVITRAGYNTCFELARMKKPFVVVPRNTDEQVLRAQMLSRGGFAHVVRDEEISAISLASALDACIKPMLGETLQITFDGAQRMAQSLAALLSGTRSTRPEITRYFD